VTGRPAAQRGAEFLIRRACRRLPAGMREDRYREWTAELGAIWHDPGIRIAALRAARTLSYAAGTYRSARRLRRAAPGAGLAANAPAGWASRSRRRPLGRPRLPDGIPLAIAAALIWLADVVVVLRASPPHGGLNYPGFAVGIASEILAAIAIVRFVRWLRRQSRHTGDR
jgi:hypothetical protein